MRILLSGTQRRQRPLLQQATEIRRAFINAALRGRKERCMKTIELTEGQREKLVKRLTEWRDEEGPFDIDIEVSENIVINAVGGVELDGYTEDDYSCGTGGYIETYRSAWVELTATVYDDDDNEEQCAVDEATEKAAERCLNAA